MFSSLLWDKEKPFKNLSIKLIYITVSHYLSKEMSKRKGDTHDISDIFVVWIFWEKEILSNHVFQLKMPVLSTHTSEIDYDI